jgi:hypothetical protein
MKAQDFQGSPVVAVFDAGRVLTAPMPKRRPGASWRLADEAVRPKEAVWCVCAREQVFKGMFSKTRYDPPMLDILALLAGLGVIGIVLMLAFLWRH